MKIGEVIYQYRTKHDMSMADFAKASGHSRSYIWLLEKGYHQRSGKPVSPTTETMQKIANAMHITVDDLFAMIDGEMEVTDDFARAIRLPVYKSISAKGELTSNEQSTERILLPEKTSDVDKLFAMRVKYNSMEPVILLKSTVIVKIQQEGFENGDIVVVNIDDGDAVCKRYVCVDDEAFLLSENRKYNLLHLTPENIKEHKIKFWGKVIEQRTTFE